ncbi:glutathione S-transferase family protein [Caulobacter sp. NIBR2454]|uniref:glutathione S-transferase family protein n=1 Tax=Caulobacter sp. NIBR2454 TaxID=3015996 RepID=UPI0022B60B0A|nr:glutathione S-transferase family protein [Caulobacter sp. NIBR2454]
MKLYSDPISTTSRPVLQFAAENGIELELVPVDMMSGGAQDPAYLRVNPNGIVPYLVDGNFSLGESSAILKYLADRVASPAYPIELQARARVNEALDWFSTNLHKDLCVFGVYMAVMPPEGIDASGVQALVTYGRTRAARWMAVLNDAMIGDRDFVCGDDITIADYLGATFVSFGEAGGFDLSPWPNVAAWMRRMRERPGFAPAYAPFYAWLAERARQTQGAAA